MHTFEEAANAVYVAVRRGKDVVILTVKKVITRFLNGVMVRTIILSDGSHYAEDSYDGRIWEVKRA